MSPIVAFHHPHNEGLEAGIITGPGFTSGNALVDTHEVDASIASFDTEAEARTWLRDQLAAGEQLNLVPTQGGSVHSQRWYDDDLDDE